VQRDELADMLVVLDEQHPRSAFRLCSIHRLKLSVAVKPRQTLAIRNATLFSQRRHSPATVPAFKGV
jgi:hypothetical protein